MYVYGIKVKMCNKLHLPKNLSVLNKNSRIHIPCKSYIIIYVCMKKIYTSFFLYWWKGASIW